MPGAQASEPRRQERSLTPDWSWCGWIVLPLVFWTYLHEGGYSLSGQNLSKKGLVNLQQLRHTFAQWVRDSFLRRQMLCSAGRAGKEGFPDSIKGAS